MKTSDFIKLLNDPELSQKMSTAKSPQETYEFAKASGVTDSFEDFVTEMEKLKNAVGELSEDDLAAVAGGSSEVEDATVIVSAVTATAAVAAVTAATAAV